MSTLKRFRPSTDSICSFAHCVESSCSIGCAHCDWSFCLNHLVEHQKIVESERNFRRSEIEKNRKRLKTIEFHDNRLELFQKLDRLVEQNKEQVKRIKTQIEQTFQKVQNEFDEKKNLLLRKTENCQTTNDENFLDSIDAMRSARLNFIVSPSFFSFRIVEPNFSSTKTFFPKEKLQRILSKSEIVFSRDFDAEETSVSVGEDFLLFYRRSRSILQVFDKNGELQFDLNFDLTKNGEINKISWSKAHQSFLLATSKQILKLNSSSKRLVRFVEIGFGFFKDVSTNKSSIVLVHHLGTSLGDVLEHYKNNELIQRCWKNDLFPHDQNKKTMEIFRIEISSNLILIDVLFTDRILICDLDQAMNIVFHVETNKLEILSITPILGKFESSVLFNDTHNLSR